MSKLQVEGLNDGIISIVTTLLVLKLPQSAGGSWNDLFAVGHKLVVYLISFVALATYCNTTITIFSKSLIKTMGWFYGRIMYLF
ncbi:TMEM175 family protein [Enterococcus alishanensis]